ncbi:MAG: hypothetical protein GY915_03620 [bacterium]|nr:hypothetical protein [bacterium]
MKKLLIAAALTLIPIQGFATEQEIENNQVELVPVHIGINENFEDRDELENSLLEQGLITTPNHGTRISRSPHYVVNGVEQNPFRMSVIKDVEETDENASHSIHLSLEDGDMFLFPRGYKLILPYGFDVLENCFRDDEYTVLGPVSVQIREVFDFHYVDQREDFLGMRAYSKMDLEEKIKNITDQGGFITIVTPSIRLRVLETKKTPFNTYVSKRFQIIQKSDFLE